jgi:hypothetical protein
LLESGNCENSKFYLTLTNNTNIVKYEWENGEIEDTISIENTGRYKLKFIDKKGCEYEIDTLISELSTKYQLKTTSNFGLEDFTFLGSAKQLNSGLILTDNISMSKGAIWQNKRINVSGDFKISVGFKVYNGYNNLIFEKSYPGADGIALVFQNKGLEQLGTSGGGIGYATIPNSMAIELDLFENYDRGDEIYDKNGNHLAIFSNKEAPNSANHNSDAFLTEKSDIIKILGDSTLYFFNVEYSSLDKVLKTSVSETEFDFTEALILNDFDFNDYLNLDQNSFTYFGITSSTGTAVQTHEITKLMLCGETATINTSVESAEDDLLIYPNPVNNELNINLTETTTSIIIYDLLGNIIFEVDNLEYKNTTYKINTIEFPIGTYILEMKTKETSHINKFYKQ